jgi:hypothetical protein
MWGLMNRRTMLAGAAAAATVSYARGPARAADLPAVTLSGGEATLRDADVAKLAKNFGGSIIQPEDADYESARKIWNAMFDRRPALIAKCAAVNDVKTALAFARERNILTAIKCGGHSISGQSVVERGMVIDLTGLRQVKVDTATKTVRVDGGCLLGDVDAAAQAVGLASTFGVVSHTGVGGLTLGGGMGRLQRQFGLAVDNLIEVELLTTEGKLVTANKDQNADLFWGVRGGGGNFGIVVNFKFQLHDFNTPISMAGFSYGPEEAKQVLSAYFDYANTAPDELWLTCSLGRNAKGEMNVNVGGDYMGAADKAEAVLKTLGTFGTVKRNRAGSMAYVALQKVADNGGRHGRYHYAKSGMLGGMNGPERAKLIDATVNYFVDQPMNSTHAMFLLMGGAINRVAADATAYPHRHAMHNIDVGGDSDEHTDGEKMVPWGRTYWEGIDPFTGGGFYVNSTIDDSDRRVRGNFGGNIEKLVALKTKYDPDNFFRLNANIKPKGKA